MTTTTIDKIDTTNVSPLILAAKIRNDWKAETKTWKQEKKQALIELCVLLLPIHAQMFKMLQAATYDSGAVQKPWNFDSLTIQQRQELPKIFKIRFEDVRAFCAEHNLHSEYFTESELVKEVWRIFRTLVVSRMCPSEFATTDERTAWFEVAMEANGIGTKLDSPPKADNRPEFADLASAWQALMKF